MERPLEQTCLGLAEGRQAVQRGSWHLERGPPSLLTSVGL